MTDFDFDILTLIQKMGVSFPEKVDFFPERVDNYEKHCGGLPYLRPHEVAKNPTTFQFPLYDVSLPLIRHIVKVGTSEVFSRAFFQKDSRKTQKNPNLYRVMVQHRPNFAS